MKKCSILMNKMLYFMVMLFLVTSCKNDSEKDVVKAYYENGNLKSELRYKDGRLNGKCVWYYPNGKPELSINYVMDTLQGESPRWYENG